jgi:hypothetical protein
MAIMIVDEYNQITRQGTVQPEQVDHRGKGPRARSPDVSKEESDEVTDVDVFLNTAMFTTQLVRIF